MSVWKRSEGEVETPENQPSAPQQAPPRRQEAAAPAPVSRGSSVATIGPSITIKGDLTGDEDLIIEGRVEGKVLLKKNNLTVGKNGKLRADVYGKSIVVEGQVEGNLVGEEDVVIRSSGQVLGDVRAPRVTLDNGCRFKGAIDMDKPQERSSSPDSRSTTSQESASQSKVSPPQAKPTDTGDGKAGPQAQKAIGASA